MIDINVEWAIDSLREFIHATDKVAYKNNPNSGVVRLGSHQRFPDSKAAEFAYVAEQILDRVLPEWRAQDNKSAADKGGARWDHLRDWSGRGIAALEREADLAANLGDNAPTISASALHRWIWSGAQSLWRSGHYRSAVEDAAKKLNAETQNKLGRRDISESKLFQEAYSDKPAAPGKSRLRRAKNDGSDTYKSMQRGAMALAEGIYAGIRNPFNHEDPKDIDEQVALEYLAALSVLARWVDESEVEVA